MTDAERTVERRIVSVLFADLVGFTTLSEELDAEDIAAIQDRYFAGVRETIGRYGGVLEKFIGDAAMAGFGAPTARDDDAERAVRAGLAIVGAIERLADQLGLGSDRLSIRVGVTTGEIVYAESGPDQGRFTGDTVNTAARLQAAAPPGGILVSRATALAVADAIELGPLEPYVLKGKTEPTLAALALGIRPERSRGIAMGALRAPILGRDAELERLTSDLATVRTTGGGHRLLVIAPPGTGKTRLLEEFVGGLDVPGRTGGLEVRRLRFRADDPRPFGALADLFDRSDLERLAALAGAGAGARASVVEDAVRRLQGADDEVAHGEHGRTAGHGTGQGQGQDALFDAWLDALAALGGPATELWIVEDAHWAEADVLAFLDRAVDRPGPGGRYVVASARPALLERAPAWCAASERVGRLDLGELPRLDAEALVRALVGDALGDALVERIADVSDGNCLFIEELLRSWVSVGLLRPEGDAWALTAPAEQVQLPTTVQAVYGGQLDDLPPGPRRVARRGSVAGRRLPVAALAPLGIDGAGEEPQEALESLVRQELLDRPVEEPIVGRAFRYRHALLRDAAYASLSRAERALLHVRLGRWLEGTTGAGDPVAEAIADHFASAADTAPSLATDIGEGLSKDAANAAAARWYERAGEIALAADAQANAARLFSEAADRTSRAALSDLARRERRAGEAIALVGDMDAAAARLDAAIAAARAERSAAAGDAARAGTARELLARAGASLSRIVAEQLRFEDAAHLAEELLAEVGDADDPAALWLVLRAETARTYFWDDASTLRIAADRAARVAEAAGDRELALEAASAALAAAASRAEGLTAAERLATLARAGGRWDQVIRALRVRALYLAETEDVGPLLAEAAEIATARGLSEALGWVHLTRAEIALETGDWELARADGRAAVSTGIAHAYHRLAVRGWFVLVQIAAQTGDEATLREAHGWYEASRERLPDSPYGRLHAAMLGTAFHDAGLAPEPDLDPDRLEPSFGTISPEGATWLESLDVVVSRWLETGHEAAARAGIAAARGAVEPETPPLSRAVLDLLEARCDVRARGEGRAVDAGRVGAAVRSALATFRARPAPWWTVKGLRLLDRLGAADEAEQAEAAAIEGRLGVTRERS